MNWKYGYHADGGYTYGYYPETMPSRLRWSALLHGQVLPKQNFRYLDAGCGQGLNLIMAAAAHPDSEFVGLDFMPEHIAHARVLAERCGLTNITFHEADFVTLANNPSEIEALGDFDYAVCHGISTWIGPTVKSCLFKLIGQLLRPGGIFYNSYNTYPGWLSIAPFQHLVLLEQEHKSGARAIEAAMTTFETLKSENSVFIKLHPALQGRLESFKKLDAAYLVQEYNNLHWAPVFVSTMIDDMAAVKLDYLGTATLGEAYLEDLPNGVKKLLNQQPTQKLKLQALDYAVNQAFRRDLYVKGKNTAWPVEVNEQMINFRFVTNPLSRKPNEGEPFLFEAGSLQIKGKYDQYVALLDQCSGKAGLTLQEFKIPGINSTHALGKMVSLLMHGGWLLPCTPETKNGTQVNLALSAAVCAGAPYKYLSLPRGGGAVAINEIDMMALQALLKKTPESAWPAFVAEQLSRLGRKLQNEGKDIEMSDAQEMIGAQLKRLQEKVVALKSLGAV